MKTLRVLQSFVMSNIILLISTFRLNRDYNVNRVGSIFRPKIPPHNSFESSQISSSALLVSLREFPARSTSEAVPDSERINSSLFAPPVNTPNILNLNILQRLTRAASFYSTAIPIFLSYKRLASTLNFRETYLQQNISESEKEVLFNRLHDWGSDEIVKKINALKGFYVKTGQIISTRVDIFPQQYTSKLAITQDQLDPLPAATVKEVIEKELLLGAPLSDLFSEFEDIPLGSASIAQVHKARLRDGRVVAVKVQRPGIASKLLGDIQNLKQFAKLIGNALLIDYYKIFVEKTLIDELDFLYEAQSTAKVAAAVAHSPSNKPQKPPVIVPLPIPGLVSKKVMVLEYVEGKALSKIGSELEKRGIKAGSPESLILGNRLLSALTDAYGSMIFGSGIIHGDPHPGNIFILEGGQVALLDCGQVKQINTAQRLGLAKLVVLVNRWETINRQLGKMKTSSPAITTIVSSSSNRPDIRANKESELIQLTSEIARLVRSFGVTFKDGAGDDCAAATAILLFGNSDTILPGGYAGEEISLDSPIVQVSEFPSELVLLGRATVMIKGIANRLGVVWGLSDRWAKMAAEAIQSERDPVTLLPVWSVSPAMIASPQPDESRMIRSLSLPAVTTRSGLTTSSTVSSSSSGNGIVGPPSQPLRFRDVMRGFRSWWLLLTEYLKNKFIRSVLPLIPQSWISWLFKWIAKLQGIRTVPKKE